ncbi:hypothetical protein, partial [Desulfofundulus salinus]|uniref:hypothetical protein n=1 Tax=Desulfofundulus salinus TaxID=2419843 RepID=UPI001A9BF2F8
MTSGVVAFNCRGFRQHHPNCCHGLDGVTLITRLVTVSHPGGNPAATAAKKGCQASVTLSVKFVSENVTQTHYLSHS